MKVAILNYKYLSIFLFAIVFISSCKKNSSVDNSIFKNGTGFLLSVLINGPDTTRFEYNSKNQLIKMWSPYNLYDSFTYSANGQLQACRLKNTSLAGVFTFRITCTYQNDQIIKAITRPYYVEAKKYVLSNEKIIKAEGGYVENGSPVFTGLSSSYTYEDSNLINCFHPFATSTYQPIDSFTYNTQFYNPYFTLGPRLWTLLTDYSTFSYNMVSGESRNIPSVETYSTYRVTNTTLEFSGTYSNKTFVLEAALENSFLPKTIKRIYDNNYEEIIKFFYTKEK